jgi:hypothetical protein
MCNWPGTTTMQQLYAPSFQVILSITTDLDLPGQ